MKSEQPRVVQMERIDCETGKVTVVGERTAPPAWRVKRKELPSEIDVTIYDEHGDCVLRAIKLDSLLSFLVASMHDNNQRQQRIAALEAELASLRQIVADVETCRGVGVENGVTIFGAAEIALVALTWPALHDDRAFEASTWQAALHAAAEHVRREQTT